MSEDDGVTGQRRCERCGTPYDDAAPESALTWARQRESGRGETLLCPSCVRAHSRDIEARLPSQWWEH